MRARPSPRSPTPRRVDGVTTNDLRVGERMRHRGRVSYQFSRPICGGLAVAIQPFPGSTALATSRPFVFVHGVGVSSRYVYCRGGKLAKSGGVSLIDLAGHGSAPDPQRDVSIPLLADVVRSFLHAASIVNPMLVGHSIGTPVVTQLASHSPEISDRLVLIAPTVNPPERRSSTVAQALLRDIRMESMRSHLIIGADYFVRCGIPYFCAQSRSASLIPKHSA